jgi:hypothetical protein
VTELSHEEAYSELAAVAIDAAEPAVAQAVRAHAAVCPECGPELAAMEQAAATLGQLVPAAPMNRGHSAGIRSRLVMKARAERESQAASVPGPPDLTRGVASLTGQGARFTPGAQRAVNADSRRPAPSHSPQIAPATRRVNWFAIAASIAFIATAAQLMRVSADRDALRDQVAAADTVAPRMDSLTFALNQKDSMIAAMAGNDVKVVPLMTQPATEPMGRMVWNRTSDDWIMVTYNLKQPQPGKTYQVWLITDKEKISAGTFRPDSGGRTVMHAHYALAPDALRAVAITEEPDGGMPSPTGPMVVSGSA